MGFSYGEPGGDLLSQARCSLSLALTRFTVLFGMGRGGSERLLPPSKGVGLLGLVNRPQLEKDAMDKIALYAVLGVVIAAYCRFLERLDIQGYRVKPHGQLVLVSLTYYYASTPSLSTWWSSTTL